MNEHAPPLPTLLRWLGELPPAMRAHDAASLERVSVRAVVHDLCETLLAARDGGPVDDDLLAAMEASPTDANAVNRLALTLRLCWLLWNPGLRAHGADAKQLRRLLVIEIAELASVVRVTDLDQEAERREELVRRGLRALGLRPDGETAAQAKERLGQVDSVEAFRIIREAEERERRARQVREELARKAAAEAAAKISRE